MEKKEFTAVWPEGAEELFTCAKNSPYYDETFRAVYDGRIYEAGICRSKKNSFVIQAKDITEGKDPVRRPAKTEFSSSAKSFAGFRSTAEKNLRKTLEETEEKIRSMTAKAVLDRVEELIREGRSYNPWLTARDIMIFEWHIDKITQTHLKAMKTFLSAAVRLGYEGFVQFQIGNDWIPNGMWAYKEISVTGHAPDGECLYRSFMPKDNFWQYSPKEMESFFPAGKDTYDSVHSVKGIEKIIDSIKKDISGARWKCGNWEVTVAGGIVSLRKNGRYVNEVCPARDGIAEKLENALWVFVDDLSEEEMKELAGKAVDAALKQIDKKEEAE